MEVAREALALAQLAGGKTYRDARIAQRESHIGFYLVDKGWLPFISEWASCRALSKAA